MLYSCYLRQGVVYIPTVGRRGSVYTSIEPVAVVPVENSEALKGAFLEVIARKNPIVPPVTGKWPKPLMLKYAGARSWPAFMRSSSTWSVEETDDGSFTIIGYRVHADGYWTEDRNQDINFPPGSSVGDVVNRMISILQDAARR